MKRLTFLIGIMAISAMLSACNQVVEVPATPEVMTITETPLITEPAPVETIEPEKFPAVYLDSAAGIQIFFPGDWSISPDQVLGERGSQTALLSPGSSLETLAEGGSRVVLVTYIWDPKNDLDAFVYQRKIAWEASGFSILKKETRDLGSDRRLVIFDIETAEMAKVLFAFTNSGENYLQISGDGDLDLCREILYSIE